MATTINKLPMIGVPLAAAEATVVASSANERRFDFAMIANGDAANARVATLRIKDGGAVLVEEIVVVLDPKAKDNNNKHTAYLWDRQAPRYLPAGWTITAYADAATVVRLTLDPRDIVVT